MGSVSEQDAPKPGKRHLRGNFWPRSPNEDYALIRRTGPPLYFRVETATQNRNVLTWSANSSRPQMR